MCFKSKNQLLYWLQKFDDIIDKGGDPNVVSYNVLLTGLCKEGRIDDVIMFFRNMPF